MNKINSFWKSIFQFDLLNKKIHFRTVKMLISAEIAIVFILFFFVGIWFWRGAQENAEGKRMTAVSMNHSAWIKNGKLYISGEPYKDQEKAEKWENLIQTAISDQHIIALDKNGVVFSAGSNASLECEIDGLKNVLYIEAGMNCSFGVLKDGTVQVFGIIDEVWKSNLLLERNVCAVDVGDEHMAVLHEDGTVTAYGKNESGQCDVMDWKNIRRIAVGYGFTVGVTKEGKVLFTGDKSYDLENVVAWKKICDVDAGNHYIIGKDENGNVYAAGQNIHGECNVNSWKNVVSMAAGYDHTIALNKKNQGFAVGFNGSGQCDIPQEIQY